MRIPVAREVGRYVPHKQDAELIVRACNSHANCGRRWRLTRLNSSTSAISPRMHGAIPRTSKPSVPESATTRKSGKRTLSPLCAPPARRRRKEKAVGRGKAIQGGHHVIKPPKVSAACRQGKHGMCYALGCTCRECGHPPQLLDGPPWGARGARRGYWTPLGPFTGLGPASVPARSRFSACSRDAICFDNRAASLRNWRDSYCSALTALVADS